MIQTFQLAKGKITFEENKLQIEDAVIKVRNHFILMIVFAFLQSCFQVYLYVKHDDLFSLVMSPIFFSFGILFIRLLYKLSTQNEILYEDIKSIQLKKRLRNHFMDIRLTNNKNRRLNLNDKSVDLDLFLVATFKEKKIA
jgi:uncharacterized protein YcgL (UPF0745 family)